MFSSQSMVLGDAVDSELFDNPEGLDELISAPTAQNAAHNSSSDL